MIKKICLKIITTIKEFWHDYDRISRQSSTELIEWEKEEMEHIFAIILFGFMVGYPSAPMHITLDLLPYMEKELALLIDKVDTAHEPLGQLFSLLDIG